MKCLIVDDEEMAIKVIENHIGHISGLEVVAMASNAMEAFSILQQQSIDLLFLDIQMPGMTGLKLLQNLPFRPHVILTTAHREFALEGYEMDVVDYLVKPISFDRFLKAVSKVYRLEKHNAPVFNHPVQNETEAPSFFYVKCERQFVKILLDEVLYIESLRNHVRIATADKSYITLMGLSQIEEKLPPQFYLRIHRSYIVAQNKIDQFSQTHLHIGDKTLPIGNLYRNEVLKRLKEFMI